MGRVRRMLRNYCPVGLPGHHKSEEVFTNLEMPVRFQLSARLSSVVGWDNCVSIDDSRVRSRPKRLRTCERG